MTAQIAVYRLGDMNGTGTEWDIICMLTCSMNSVLFLNKHY